MLDNRERFHNHISRVLYYTKGLFCYCYPRRLLRLDYCKLEDAMHRSCARALRGRLDYYHKITSLFDVPDDAVAIKDISLRGSGSMYFFDLMEYARFFPKHNKIAYLFCDVTHVPDAPTLVKSRPIGEHNSNSVLFKFCKIRNFRFPNDRIPFRQKQDKLIWRGAAYQPHRIAFLERFFNASPLLDVGQHNKSGTRNPQWQMPFMTIGEQLQNKCVLAIEGNDVATNTKWAMASNSLLFMTRPKYETWFLEGQLKPNFHYVLVKDDYSDLEALVEYYINRPDEAEAIIRNANEHVEQFKDPRVEDWLGLKVLERYFQCSRQEVGCSPSS